MSASGEAGAGGPPGQVEIVPFEGLDAERLACAAEILRAGFAGLADAWPDAEAAAVEVRSFLDDPERLGLALLESDELRGWIGAIRHSETSWELHPLVVDAAYRGRGYGTRLVRALEALARAAHVTAIWLGTDDEYGGTNLFGRDLYPDVLGALQSLAPASGHPFTFYRRLGYAVTGVLPDADGPGRHDIIMARRITDAPPP